MTTIDNHARAAGRINAIDAAAVVFLVVALAAGVFVYRAARGGSVHIESVTPHGIVAGQQPSLQVHGVGLRPYLTAFVVRAGQPFALNQVDRFLQQAPYSISAPTLAEIKCPPNLTPGAYDLYLYDEGQQVAVKPAAFDVAAADVPRGVMSAKVRFFVPDETIPLIKVGDRDQPPPVGPNLPLPGGAVVEAIAVGTEKTDTLDMHMVEREELWIGRRVQGRAVDLTLRVPVLKLGHRNYQYTSLDLLRAGDIFTLSTPRYKLHGLVLWVSDVDETPGAAPPTS
jgi:hypothetical protein